MFARPVDNWPHSPCTSLAYQSRLDLRYLSCIHTHTHTQTVSIWKLMFGFKFSRNNIYPAAGRRGSWPVESSWANYIWFRLWVSISCWQSCVDISILMVAYKLTRGGWKAFDSEQSTTATTITTANCRHGHFKCEIPWIGCWGWGWGWSALARNRMKEEEANCCCCGLWSIKWKWHYCYYRHDCCCCCRCRCRCCYACPCYCVT